LENEVKLVVARLGQGNSIVKISNQTFHFTVLLIFSNMMLEGPSDLPTSLIFRKNEKIENHCRHQFSVASWNSLTFFERGSQKSDRFVEPISNTFRPSRSHSSIELRSGLSGGQVTFLILFESPSLQILVFHKRKCNFLF
jgi:hypothetical protein